MAKKTFMAPKNDNLAEPMSDLVPDEYKGTDRYLDVVAWNIRYFHDKDPQRVKNVVDVLGALNADVFVFEEILDDSLEVVAQELGRIGAGNYSTSYGTTGGQQRVAMMHDLDWVRAKDDPAELFGKGQVLTGAGKDAFPRLPLHNSFACLPSSETSDPFDFQLVGLHLKSQRVSAGAEDGEDADQRSLAADRLARWLTTDASDVDTDVILVGDWNKPPTAPEWKVFRDLEDDGLARFTTVNDTSDVSHLMYRSASEYGSRLDLGAVSIAAAEKLVAGASVARWKTLDDLLDASPKAAQIKQLIRDLSRDVSDHMPLVMRFYFLPEDAAGGATSKKKVTKKATTKKKVTKKKVKGRGR